MWRNGPREQPNGVVFIAVNALPALVVDVVAVVVFAIVGRSSHAETNTFLGVLGTAWPFLAGVLVGHAVCLLVAPLRADPTRWRTGLAVWAGTLVVGMVLRAISGGGIAWTFVLVAGIVLAVMLLGWRVLTRLAGRARYRSDASA